MPAPSVDYDFATVSPWAGLGHARFVAMTQAVAPTAHVKPMVSHVEAVESGKAPVAPTPVAESGCPLLTLKPDFLVHLLSLVATAALSCAVASNSTRESRATPSPAATTTL